MKYVLTITFREDMTSEDRQNFISNLYRSNEKEIKGMKYEELLDDVSLGVKE